MINFNSISIVGVDLGYGNIKTSRTIFPTGLTAHNSEPVFSGKILQFGGRFYKIGDCHKPFIPDKTVDGDFYILTLAAIASELQTYSISEANVHIAAGLPLSWVKNQREQ
ncbi:MAG: plasmid segregation actin-type ATPase ParM, partial [Eubacterium sp.]|nr:plasmid segregation actin-type ATPase ParM [Eubacterium sp.]